jgi:hypothetical protein
VSTCACKHAHKNNPTKEQTNRSSVLDVHNFTTTLSRGKTERIQTTIWDNRKYQQATAFNVPIKIFLTGM